jgi:hypothetical protein
VVTLSVDADEDDDVVRVEDDVTRTSVELDRTVEDDELFLQSPKPGWQPVPQYAVVLPLLWLDVKIRREFWTYQYEYWEQQFPKVLPRQVRPPKSDPHRADVLTRCAIAIGTEANARARTKDCMMKVVTVFWRKSNELSYQAKPRL